MQQIIVQLSDEEYKAINNVIADVTAWVQNAISNRARQAMDEIILRDTTTNPKKLTPAEKQNIISTLPLKPAVPMLQGLIG